MCKRKCAAQVAPTPALLPSLAACGLRIRLHVSPPQDVLPELYRGHDALLFTSRYEAWGMPVLEAMAAGLPTVASACLGVQAFARHDVNALLADPQARPAINKMRLCTQLQTTVRPVPWKAPSVAFPQCKCAPRRQCAARRSAGMPEALRGGDVSLCKGRVVRLGHACAEGLAWHLPWTCISLPGRA